MNRKGKGEKGEPQSTKADMKLDIIVEKVDKNCAGNEIHNNSLFSKQVEDTSST